MTANDPGTTITARNGRIHARSHVGEERGANEDAVLVTSLTPACDLVAVADGMGGHRAGDIASATALSAFESALAGRLDADEHETGNGAYAGADHTEALREAAGAANAALDAAAESDPGLEGMGTTLVGALLCGRRAAIVNVGDSRAYHADDGLTQVTVDHSLVQELVASGTLTSEEACEHPQRNVITQSLSPDNGIEPDTYTVDIEGALLLCSDGLTEEVPADRIETIVQTAGGPADITAQLVAQANENGGSDNVSVVLADP
jgi:protein phosphatase